MNIENYIKCNRKIRSETIFDEILKNQYIKKYSNIESIINSKTEIPKIRITNSSNRICEIIKIDKKNEEYIIYDQYISTTLNMLNRIYFNSTDTNDIIMYSYKILAEKLQLISEHQLSAAFSIAYVSLKEKQKSYKNEKNLEKRPLYLDIQETFILFHELAHNMFRLDGREVSQEIQEIREVILELFKSNKQDEEINALEVVESIARVFGEDISEDKKKDDAKKILKVMDNKKFEDELYNIVASKDYIIEEIICDSVALENTLKYYKKFSIGLCQDDIVAAVYLGILHLELISLIDKMAINRFKDKNLSDINTLNECIIRKMAIINLFYVKSSTNINLDLIKQINNRYSKIIKDPALFKLDSNILNFEKEHINDLFKDMNQFEITACIDEILDSKIELRL